MEFGYFEGGFGDVSGLQFASGTVNINAVLTSLQTFIERCDGLLELAATCVLYVDVRQSMDFYPSAIIVLSFHEFVRIFPALVNSPLGVIKCH